MQKIPYIINISHLNVLLNMNILDLGLDFNLDKLLCFHELLDLDEKLKALSYLSNIYSLRYLSQLNLYFYFPFFIDSFGRLSSFGHSLSFFKHNSLKNIFVFNHTNNNLIHIIFFLHFFKFEVVF